MNRASCIAWGFVLAAFILLAAFFCVFYDMTPKGVYETRMSQLHTEQAAVLLDILGYLNHYRQLPTELTPAEANHMHDVRILIDIAKIIFAVLFLGLLWLARAIYRTFKKAQKGKREAITAARIIIASGSIIALAIIALLGISSLFDFTSFWTSFHHALFPQGNWMFPSDSVLITLFPEEFFSRFTSDVLLAAASFALLALIVSFMLRSSFRAPTRS